MGPASMPRGQAVAVDDAVKAKLGEGLASKLQARLESASTSALFKDAVAAALEKRRDESAFEAFMQSLDEQKVGKSREALVNDLVIKTGVMAQVLSVFGQALESQMRVANSLLPARQGWSDEDIARAVAENRKEIGGQMQLYITANLLYTYKDFKDAELKQYVDFLLSKGGQWYKGGLIAGIGDGYQAVMRRAVAAK